MAYKYQYIHRNNWCGIACLSMIYANHGITKSQEDIFCDIAKAGNLLDDGIINMTAFVSDINKNSALSACSVKPVNLGDFLSFASDGNFSVLLSCRERFGDGFHCTIFERVEEGLIHGIDPDNEDIFPISIDDLNEMFKSIHRSHVTIITDNSDLFKEHKATCGHYFKIPNIPTDLADFVLCPSCLKWRRMSKMTPVSEGLITYKFGERMLTRLNERLSGKETYDHVANFIATIVKKIEKISDKAQEETGQRLPQISMDEDKTLPGNEFAVYVNNTFAEQFSIDLDGTTLQDIEDKIIELYEKWTRKKEKSHGA
ncbi:MAG: C39 family peptidase [Defluviitaleaceae bacterium]|nr:C39 family peptidase [Defluviitaleaceae bacterium]